MKVRVGYGKTWNIGNYESLRMYVEIEETFDGSKVTLDEAVAILHDEAVEQCHKRAKGVYKKYADQLL